MSGPPCLTYLSRGSLGVSSPLPADIKGQTYTEPELCC